MLSLKSLYAYDLLAPIDHIHNILPGDKDTILFIASKLRAIDPNFEDIIKRMYEQGHINTFITSDKESSAFTHFSQKNDLPFILLNYNKDTDITKVLAYEFGHAIYYAYVQKYSGYFHWHLHEFLKEVLSFFIEQLVLNVLITENKNKKYYLDTFVNATIYNCLRQVMFFEMVQEVLHTLPKNDLTADDYTSIALKHLKNLYKNVKGLDKYQYVFFLNYFYLYRPLINVTYVFSMLISSSMTQNYLQGSDKEQKEIINNFKTFISHGQDRPYDEIIEQTLNIQFDEDTLVKNYQSLLSAKIKQLKEIIE